MKIKKKAMRSFLVIFTFSILFGCSKPATVEPDLADGFRDPGKEARPRAYWNWLNGDVSPGGLTRDLEEAIHMASRREKEWRRPGTRGWVGC